jgi:hypothetical protein
MSSPFRVVAGEEWDFHTALYNAACQQCGARLAWQAHFDADGTTYHAECCGLTYGLSPSKVILSVEGE